MSEWISVKDKLPPEECIDHILIYAFQYSVCASRALVGMCIRPAGKPHIWIDDSDNQMLREDEYEVTHWKPLELPE